MFKIAEFIVDKRKAFFVVFLVAFMYCLTTISKVKVENDLAEYLPETTETRIGVDIMDEEFKTFGSARVLITNVTYDRAFQIAQGLKEIDGISRVLFYDEDDELYNDKSIDEYYRDSSALMTLSFEEEKETDLSQKAIAEVRDYVRDYDSYVYTTVDQDDSAELIEDVKLILVIVAFVILGVLIFTSTTYMEIPIFIATFVMAAALNKGTNFFLGTISFISNAVDVVLQLALAIDYAIILFHRFMEEKNRGLNAHDAMVQALGKAIVEISSSSLTTIGGLAALIFMQYRIGMDLGIVLIKAIALSMLTVFLFMPALIMMAQNNIEKTRHRNFVPKINYWGKFIFSVRHILPVVFLVIAGFSFYFSGKCPYIFDKNSASSYRKTDYIIAKERIEQTFDIGNQMALILPKGDYDKEAQVIAMLEEQDCVDTITALANVEIGEAREYVLTDALNPREFAEIAEIDVGLSRVLYTAYAQDREAIGAFIDGIDTYRVPVLNMIDYIYEEKEKGAFNLSDKQSEDLDDIHEDIDEARKQLEGENYSRIVFVLMGDVEGKETFANVDRIRAMAQEYYSQRIYLVGDPTCDYDLSSSFSHDNTLISVLTAFLVGMVLLFTFQSAGLPFVLLLTIQGSIWINFSIPYLMDSPTFFLGYLIVSSIQMGATIDYAIVITNRYLSLRTECGTRREAIIQSLNEAFPTIVTSGVIMAVCGFVVGFITSNGVISQLGLALCRGTATSIILVMSVLPILLFHFDPFIEKTSFSINTNISPGKPVKAAGLMYINGSVRGYFSGYLNGAFSGTLNGDMDITLRKGEHSPGNIEPEPVPEENVPETIPEENAPETIPEEIVPETVPEENAPEEPDAEAGGDEDEI